MTPYKLSATIGILLITNGGLPMKQSPALPANTDFTDTELTWIRRLIIDQPEASRKDLPVLVCQKTNWLKADGGLKDMSCRVA
jgi:hypothetical protein